MKRKLLTFLTVILALGTMVAIEAPSAHASLGSNVWTAYYSYVNGPNSVPVAYSVSSARVPQWQVGSYPGTRLTFQPDVHLVEYGGACGSGNCVDWASAWRSGLPTPGSFNIQADGNVCVYPHGQGAIWCTGTWTTAHLPYYIALWSGGCLEVEAALSSWHRVWSNGWC